MEKRNVTVRQPAAEATAFVALVRIDPATGKASGDVVVVRPAVH